MNRMIGVRRAVSLLALIGSACASAAAAQQGEPVQRVVVRSGVDSIYRVVESPNGRFLAGEGDHGMTIYDRRADRVRKLGFVGHVMQWNRAGDRLVFLREDDAGAMHIWTVAIDTATGAAAGAPRRISLEPGVGGSFSPDGREVAYMRQRADGGRDLVIMPSSGGPARVVARLPGEAGFTHWSPDGEWIYFGHQTTAGIGQPGRVRAAGGPIEAFGSGVFRGLSADGRYMAWMPEGNAMDQSVPLVVASADGRELVRTTLRARSWWPTWSGSGHRMLFAQLESMSSLYQLDLQTGAAAPLTSSAQSDRIPQFSPTGDRIAVQRRMNGGSEIAVLNADGSLLRQYRTRSPTSWHVWSPDARHLAYHADVPSQLYVLDLESGTERRIAGDPEPATPWARFAWRSDGSGIIRVEQASPTSVVEFVTISLDGTRRVLARMPPFPTNDASFDIVGDSVAAVWTTDALHVVDLRNGRTRVVFEGTDDNSMDLAVSPDGRSAVIVQAERPGPGHRDVAVLVPLYGGAARRLQYTAGCGMGVGWHPTGEYVVANGWDTCESTLQSYLVPLDGGTPRLLTRNVPGNISETDLSPDGRKMVLAVTRAEQMRFIEIDFGPALPGARR